MRTGEQALPLKLLAGDTTGLFRAIPRNLRTCFCEGGRHAQSSRWVSSRTRDSRVAGCLRSGSDANANPPSADSNSCPRHSHGNAGPSHGHTYSAYSHSRTSYCHAWTRDHPCAPHRHAHTARCYGDSAAGYAHTCLDCGNTDAQAATLWLGPHQQLL